MQELERKYDTLAQEKQGYVKALTTALKTNDEAQINTVKASLQAMEAASGKIRDSAKVLIRKADPGAETNDTNYIFLHFVVNNLPQGLVGLLIAIIFLASWGSIAAALNSLASTTMIDVYQRMIRPDGSDADNLRMSKWITLGWGIFSIAVAQFATGMGSLIEAVNILGSLFYGTILGIFVVAFTMKRIGGDATFLAAVIAEIAVVIIWLMDSVSFLWLNVIGCLLVMALALCCQLIMGSRRIKK